MKDITSSKLIIFISLFFITFGNNTFFRNVLSVYPLNAENSIFLLSLIVVLFSINIILLSLLCYKYTIKPILIIIVIITSLAAYFMDTYHIIINDMMITNIIETNLEESLDVLSTKLFLYCFFFGILPSIAIYKANIIHLTLKSAFISRLKLIGLSTIVALSIIFILSSSYSYFFREQKPLRYYANPSSYLYSIVKYIDKIYENRTISFKQIGLDAQVSSSDTRRKLIFVVVGEAARSDHFSLNGYNRETTPFLEKEKVISFKNFWACGTSTAVSIPCMFSIYGHADYNKTKANSTDNVLDVLQRAGIHVVWLDNNSDSKGVAERIPYESYKTADKNPACDIECRDEGMLTHLQTYIDKYTVGDIVIVLHQMGSHGPAYYKRYPAKFEKFTPTCQTNQLKDCKNEEISNAYDNTILYTDYFLSKAIALLKQNSNQFESALLYISDHGESLGENGVYLHGLPYTIAPDAQKHAAMIMWFSDNFDKRINIDALKNNANKEYTHDNIFHTLLGLMEVQTNIYNGTMDLLKHKANVINAQK